ncbi:thiol peroxidase [Spirochaetota bacterium]|nr:thiol peroxidase [Spirochaetota bacterium]
MSPLMLKGSPVEILGKLPEVATIAKDFAAVTTGLEERTLYSYGKKNKILNVFPSLDTHTCALSVKKFNESIKNNDNVVVLNISKDLPFAMGRFCKSENIKNVEVLSVYRSTFSDDYGLTFKDGPLQGLCSRAIVVLDANNKIIYTEQVKEISEEPNYDQAFQALNSVL